MLVYNKFIDEGFDAEGRLNRFELKPGVDFNFGFDCVDVLGTEKPDKTAMMWVSKHGEERRFTFEDMIKTPTSVQITSPLSVLKKATE